MEQEHPDARHVGLERSRKHAPPERRGDALLVLADTAQRCDGPVETLTGLKLTSEVSHDHAALHGG
ncbi:hypothetical protein ACIQU6_17315 [Streptomyces sp. NPDC090442]|uniref:hypothetical protein n=1 Tax=Streptomyces sp. NPDC090442 TaxID=3365962 RepID=UPI0038257F88